MPQLYPTQLRIAVILKVVKGRTLILLIDETGDCKKGKNTDYVKRQYIGNVGKKENGIVAVTAYGLVDGMILPLSFEVYKPRERLKAGDEYQSKPQIAAAMIRRLQSLGFQFELVLADSLYGESKTNFVDVLDELKLPYILAIRSNHALWLPLGASFADWIGRARELGGAGFGTGLISLVFAILIVGFVAYLTYYSKDSKATGAVDTKS